MSKKKPHPGSTRDAPDAQGAGIQTALVTPDAWKILTAESYRPVTSLPEVQMCIGVYADLIASMTIQLMRNAENGDMRIRNALSRKLDITPAKRMTRHTFVQNLVRVLFGAGEGNEICYPVYREGLLQELKPLKPSGVHLVEDGDDYHVEYFGERMEPDEVLHFVLNPDPERPWRGQGYTVSLADMCKCIRQANATRAAMLESPMPSLIVKVDSTDEDFRSAAGRRAMGRQYLDASENGRPWFIPGEIFDVTQVKPLTLNDLAIRTNLELDKRAVAALLGVPPFMVGIGDFKEAEYRHFVATRVMAVAQMIQQELTKKLLVSEDLYIKFGAMSLYAYALSDLVTAGAAMVDRQSLRRNEWRDWIGLSPDEEMDELLALENYIPVSRLGDQKKLKGGKQSEQE